MSSLTGRRWVLRRPCGGREEVDRLAAGACISRGMAKILLARGISTPSSASNYFEASLRCLHDPALLPDMGRALDRLEAACKGRERVLIFGDYDADGLTGAAILCRALSKLGAKVSVRIPHRVLEGYGLNEEAVGEAKRGGATLLIVVDSGTTAFEEIRLANSLGLDVIVVDHHEPEGRLPPAFAIINPKRFDSAYPFRELTSSGLALKLVGALCPRFGISEELAYLAYLDLAALGTVADVAPLIGENRAISREGLDLLSRTSKKGLRALQQVAGLWGGPITSYHAAFILAPRLNAAGRMEHAKTALELLLSNDEVESLKLARHLDRLNRLRQRTEEAILKEAEERISKEVDLSEEWALVLASPSWHVGVVGIVASRLVERYNRPALLVCVEGEEARGSARGVEGMNLHEALEECSDLLTKFGGHSMAAGFSLKTENLWEFRRRFNEAVKRRLKGEDLEPKVVVDAILEPGEVHLGLARDIARMEPFGQGNPKPVVALRGVELREVRAVGGGRHLRMAFRLGGREVEDATAGTKHLGA
ncbi:MAG TPA: single-stranded-DNA-specific exonuclease RecJ [Armatimonadetes bacterium]|nr:single-stranded-DNA-specific exonuclease RecJ [Armatimonadota bacterium]